MATPPGFADVSIQLTLTGMARPAYITFGVDPTDTDPSAIAGSVNTASAAANSLYSILDNSVSITGVRVSLGTDGGEDLVAVLPTVSTGASAKVSLPPNCALLVHKHTARGGRRGRGRLFIPWCLVEADVDESGNIPQATLTPLQAAMNTWRIALSTNQVPMCLLHQPSAPGTAVPTTPGPPNLVTSLVADKLIGTQRRRLGR